VLVLEQAALARLKELAEGAYPKECCGALLGRRQGDRRLAAQVLPLENAAREAHRAFAVSDHDLLRAEDIAWLRGLEIVGFFHSHPDGESHPSQADSRYALPACSYPILSVEQGKIREVYSFAKAGETLRPESLSVEEEEGGEVLWQ
jgi:proteasome lid subunit RPN8/RPN11